MKYKVSLNGKTYEVEVEKGEAKMIAVTETVVAAPAVAPIAAVPAAPAAPAAPAPAAVAAGEPLNAPMPGMILRINVTEGQAVKRGDVLLILEAMKMENEITAPRDAVIKQIVAAKGAQVASGAPLLVLG